MTKLLAICALALAACNPYLTAQSPAPPGRSARLDEVKGFWGQVKSYRLELSRGTAIAITCRYGTPCEHIRAVSDNPAIAEVRPASLGVLEKHEWSSEAQTSSALVVVGKMPGTTHVHVSAKEGNRDIAVTILGTPDPAPAVASTPAAPRS